MRNLTRRGALAGGMALAPSLAFADKPVLGPMLGTVPSVVSNPPRDFGPNAAPYVYPDPDVITIDPVFNKLRLDPAAIKRVATGFQWCEGPAWNAQGQYVVFSDVKGDTQYRYTWESGAITAFRKPSFNSNGNSFDFDGRQLSCQHYLRRVVRWEHDGSMTVIADSYQGKPLNSPNDIVAHPDGSIWFSDPPYGSSLSEGHPDDGGVLDPRLGELGMGLPGSLKQVLPTNIYRWDPSGRLEVISGPIDGGWPNGLAFSPDFKTLYAVGGINIYAAEMRGTGIGPFKLFTDCMVDGIKCKPDGFRVDRQGNLWCGAKGPLGYSGVTVWNPQGNAIGRIRLPEVCANLCFAGPKRDWLFLCATQSIYLLRVSTQGAGPG